MLVGKAQRYGSELQLLVRMLCGLSVERIVNVPVDVGLCTVFMYISS